MLAKVIGGWGLQWDIQWHMTIGRDSFWIAPHVMMYVSVAVALVVGFAILGLTTADPSAGRSRAGRVRVLGLCGSPGFHLAAWGAATVVLAAPVDDLWHRLFGIDVTLWSPPHLLGLFGSAVNALGCLVIAREVYEGRSRTGLVAILLSGALLYGGLRVVLDPAYLLAYNHGGVLFHAYSILAALVLPLALLPASSLSRVRWAPVAVVAIVVMLSMGGDAVARVGFAIVKPVSVISEEIKKAPDSTIAVANAITAKNRGIRPAWARVVPLIPVMLMALVDPRLRPVGSTATYAVALFAISGWYLAGRPAYQPVVPTSGETAIALLICLVAALVGAVLARRLIALVDPEPSASATSPGR